MNIDDLDEWAEGKTVLSVIGGQHFVMIDFTDGTSVTIESLSEIGHTVDESGRVDEPEPEMGWAVFDTEHGEQHSKTFLTRKEAEACHIEEWGYSDRVFHKLEVREIAIVPEDLYCPT